LQVDKVEDARRAAQAGSSLALTGWSRGADLVEPVDFAWQLRSGRESLQSLINTGQLVQNMFQFTWRERLDRV
jgi:hypothetical protein